MMYFPKKAALLLLSKCWGTVEPVLSQSWANLEPVLSQSSAISACRVSTSSHLVQWLPRTLSPTRMLLQPMFCQGHLLWMHEMEGRLSSSICLVPEESTGKIPRWWPWWKGTWSVSCRCWSELIARVSLLFGRKWRWSVWASKATMIEFWAPRDRRRLLPWRQMAWQLSLLACPLISWTLCFCQCGII